MNDMNLFKRLWHTIQRLGHILWDRLESNQSFLRASSLSFQSVFTIVPLLAVMFGIAKGFGLEILLQNILQEEFHDQQEVINYFIQFGYRLLEQTRGGLIAGIGTIVLLFTVMRLFSNVEHTLNAMWGVKAGRSLVRKASDYLALILICPILIVASSSITVFITTKLHQITASGTLPEPIGPYLLYIIPLIPYLMSTILFMIIYIIMPNTYVRLRSSLIAGIFAGSAYQILQGTYISIQIQVSNAGAIYGSFAALPLFLMWLYLSWVIFLIGAQLVVIHQEKLWDRHISAPFRPLSPYERKLALLAIVKACVDGYQKASAMTQEKLAHVVGLPENKIAELVDELLSATILFKVAGLKEQTSTFIPAISPDTLRLYNVLSATEGSNSLTSSLIKTLDKLLSQSRKELLNSPANPLIKEIHPSD